MSHLGIQILYHILNSRKDIFCERVFAPWIDLENLLKEKGMPLSSLETSTPLAEFDLLGFSLQYELSYTNILNMLSLSGIPFLAAERDERFPLIIAGGPTAFNPAPVADFFDAILIGDGEEAIVEICDLTLRWKESGKGKEDLLRALCRVGGGLRSLPPHRRQRHSQTSCFRPRPGSFPGLPCSPLHEGGP